MEIRIHTDKARGLVEGHIAYFLQRTEVELAALEGSVGGN